MYGMKSIEEEILLKFHGAATVSKMFFSWSAS